MATATSRRVNSSRIDVVRMETAGMMGSRVIAAVEISWISRWPAVRFAVRRTPRASGRISKLMVSIMINAGISGVGVPSGSRWPREIEEVGGQAVLGSQPLVPTPCLTERHGYDPTCQVFG